MPLPDAPLLEVRGVRASYGSIEVLHGVDLSVPGGSIVAVLGPNGAGKSSTLRVIAGLLSPTHGRVFLEGHDVTGVPPDRLARAGVCLIPEGGGVFPNLTVRENILMDTFVAASASADDLEALAYERFPVLGQRRDQVAGTLSGGEQRMLALARALTTDPALLLLDELSIGLAPLIVEQLFAVVRHVTSAGTTAVVVEQFAELVLGFADAAVLMSQGVVRAAGRPAEIRSQLAGAYLGAS